MDPAKATVRHDRDHVVFSKLGSQVFDDRVRVRKTHCGFALKSYVGDELVDIQNLAEFARFRRIVNARNDHIVGLRKCFAVRLLKNASLILPKKLIKAKKTARSDI